MKNKFVQKIIFFLAIKLGSLFIMALGKSIRVTVINKEYLDALYNENARILFVLWHGRMFIPIFCHRNQGITAMVSQHADGEMIAQMVHKLGYRTVRGSSTRGGNEAFHGMVSVLKTGAPCAIIPDGPQGPRHMLKPGALYISQQCGAYLCPITFASKRKKEFRSWDRFYLPGPFTKSVLVYGEPMRVPQNISAEQLEEIRQQFEAGMIDLEKQADDYFPS
ncbi:MAG: lysophospholipid acyltransferase family protein [Candidatus Zhuqueibacterota bacterium]